MHPSWPRPDQHSRRAAMLYNGFIDWLGHVLQSCPAKFELCKAARPLPGQWLSGANRGTTELLPPVTRFACSPWSASRVRSSVLRPHALLAARRARTPEEGVQRLRARDAGGGGGPGASRVPVRDRRTEAVVGRRVSGLCDVLGHRALVPTFDGWGSVGSIPWTGRPVAKQGDGYGWTVSGLGMRDDH